PAGSGWVKTSNLHSFRDIAAGNQVVLNFAIQWSLPSGPDPGDLLVCPELPWSAWTVYNQSATTIGNWLLTSEHAMPNAAQYQVTSGMFRFPIFLTTEAPASPNCTFNATGMERGALIAASTATEV